MEQGGVEVSLLKAIGASIGMFVLYTISGVIFSLVPVFVATLLMQLAGFEEGSTPVVVVAAIAFVGVMFVCWEQAIEYAYYAIKERPRGLGLRRVKKWKDHVPYYDWEKY